MKLLSIPFVVRRYGLPLIAIIVFGALFAFAVKHLLYESHTITDRIVVDDVARLGTILQRIDERCRIMAFDRQKSPIDFLTVEKFVGSEIGSMNLMLPKKWQGPYVEDNPAVQGKVYEVVRTHKGYFIAPGTGVRLNNGRVMGKDIVLDENADIEAMMLDPQKLNFEGKPLAVRISVSGVIGGRILGALVPEKY